MYDYDYYYEQEPSEIDQMIEEAVDKVKRTILLRAKDEVERQTLKAEKLQKQYDSDKKSLTTFLNEERKKVKELEEELKVLKENYEKKRTSIPSLDFEIGENVLIAVPGSEKQLFCPTCKGKGVITLEDTPFGKMETKCPHCNGSEWKSKGNFVKKILYNTYVPFKTTIDNVSIKLNKNEKDEEINISYYVRNCYSQLISPFKVFPLNDLESCKKYCEELTKKSLEEAKQYIYSEEKDNDEG